MTLGKTEPQQSNIFTLPLEIVSRRETHFSSSFRKFSPQHILFSGRWLYRLFFIQGTSPLKYTWRQGLPGQRNKKVPQAAWGRSDEFLPRKHPCAFNRLL